MTLPDSPSEDRSGGVVRLIVIPVVLLAAIIVPSLRVLQSAQVEGIQGRLWCQTYMMKTRGAASDVLFLGASRTGAGVDTIIVEQHLVGDLKTAEKGVLTGGSEYDRDLFYRTYTKYRGVPRVLALQLSIDRRAAPAEPLEWPTVRTFKLFDTDVQASLMTSLRSRGEVSFFDTYVRSRYISEPAFFLERLNVGTDFALRDPSRAWSPEDECGWGTKPVKNKWVLGNSSPYVEGKTKVVPKNQQERWAKNVARIEPMDPDHAYTKSEIALMHDLIDTAYSDGVERVVLFYLPSAGESRDLIDLKWFAAEFPEVTIMDGRTVLVDDARPGLRWQFANLNHVNRFAAYELSVALAAFVQGGNS